MSDTLPPTNGVADVINYMGVWFSALGVPRAAGQMFGYLLVCEPAEQSAGEIAAGIGISRASVSSNARLLSSMNAIEERHRVGDRKTYYRMRRNWWIEVTVAKMGGFKELAEMARRTVAAGGLARTDGLDEMIEFTEFWSTEIPELVERWNRRHDDTKEDE